MGSSKRQDGLNGATDSSEGLTARVGIGIAESYVAFLVGTVSIREALGRRGSDVKARSSVGTVSFDSDGRLQIYALGRLTNAEATSLQTEVVSRNCSPSKGFLVNAAAGRGR